MDAVPPHQTREGKFHFALFPAHPRSESLKTVKMDQAGRLGLAVIGYEPLGVTRVLDNERRLDHAPAWTQKEGCDLVEAAERALALVEALCTGEATATIESANVRPETVVGVQAALRSAYTRLRHNEKAGGSIAQQNSRLQRQSSMSDVIELNVGGRHVTTCRRTLCAARDSMLASMFSGRHRVAQDKTGRYVLDRNPDVFQHVLDYLRAGGVGDVQNLPDSLRDRERILAEFDYFCIPLPDRDTPVFSPTFWPLREGVRLQTTTLSGHTSEVNSVCVVDERLVVSCADDGTVRAWDPTRRQCLWTARDHQGPVHCVAHNGDRVASGGHNGVVIVHDVRTGEQLLTIEGTARSIVTGMKAQGGRLAVSGYDKSARVYDMATGALLLQLSDRAAAALADDGRTFVCANGRDVEMWDIDGGARVEVMRGNTEAVADVHVTSEYVVSRDVYSMFIRWERQSGELCARLRCRVSVLDTMFRGFECTDADTVAFANGKGVDVWSFSAGARIARVDGPNLLAINSISAASWGLAAACADGRVRAWRLFHNLGAESDANGARGA